VRHYKNQRVLDQFGKRIKALREAADLSQEQIQKAIGISQPHLAQIENGKYNFRVSYIALLGEFYGLEDYELLDYKSPIPEGDELRKSITKFLKRNSINPSVVLKKSITTIFEKSILPSKFLNVPHSTKEIAHYISDKHEVEFTTTLVSRTLGILVKKGILEQLPTDKKSKFQYRKIVS
jgi:transcriptional regulator with XRE-family HTH domain